MHSWLAFNDHLNFSLVPVLRERSRNKQHLNEAINWKYMEKLNLIQKTKGAFYQPIYYKIDLLLELKKINEAIWRLVSTLEIFIASNARDGNCNYKSVTQKQQMKHSQAACKLPRALPVSLLHRMRVCQVPPSLIARTGEDFFFSPPFLKSRAMSRLHRVKKYLSEGHP